MKIEGNFLERGFSITHKGKRYYVNYADADYSSPILLNRDNWKVADEDREEISPYIIKSVKNKKGKEETNLYYELVEFCIKNFDNFKLKLRII